MQPVDYTPWCSTDASALVNSRATVFSSLGGCSSGTHVFIRFAFVSIEKKKKKIECIDNE